MSILPFRMPFPVRPTALWEPALKGLDVRDDCVPHDLPPSMGLAPLNIDEYRQIVNALRAKSGRPSAEGFFARDGMTHKVFGSSAPMFLGLTPIFYELAHYGVGFSIAKSGSFAKTPLLRGLRTYMFSSTVGYGSLDEASKMAEFLFRLHSGIKGDNPRAVPGLDATTYHAADPAAMLWVWATLMKAGLDGYEMFVGPLTLAEREVFYQDSKPFGILFGVPETIIPANYGEFLAYFRTMLKSPAIWVSPEAKETGRQLFENIPGPLRPCFEALTAATLTPELRKDFGLTWDESVARRADRFILAVRSAYAHAPARLTEAPMKSALRARIGEGDRVDEIVRDVLDFAFAVGTEAKANAERPVPLSRIELLAKSVKRARRN